jgi:hypothetical protein
MLSEYRDCDFTGFFAIFGTNLRLAAKFWSKKICWTRSLGNSVAILSIDVQFNGQNFKCVGKKRLFLADKRNFLPIFPKNPVKPRSTAPHTPPFQQVKPH